MTWQSAMWLIRVWPGASLCVKLNPLNTDLGEHKVYCVGDCHVACSWGFYGIFLILSLRQLKCMHSTVGVYNNSGPSLTLIFKKAKSPHPHGFQHTPPGDSCSFLSYNKSSMMFMSYKRSQWADSLHHVRKPYYETI